MDNFRSLEIRCPSPKAEYVQYNCLDIVFHIHKFTGFDCLSKVQ